jgi:hypothetical protein
VLQGQATSAKQNPKSKVSGSKKGGEDSRRGTGSRDSAPPRRSSRGSVDGRGGKQRTHTPEAEEENELENGDKGNIFDRMKSWKKQEEKKEDTAWEQAIVSQEQKIANGEEVCDVMCMHV